MIVYIWPLALVIICNTFYQLCAKSVPEAMNPFASLTVTYVVGAIMSFIMYLVMNRTGGTFVEEMKKLNWAPFVLGLVIVGLEVGWIFAYKAGWQVSTGFIVQSAFLAIILIFVGFIIYREAITWNKILGVAICLAGLVFINMK